MARKPVVADMFYEGGFEKLDEQVKSSFLGRMGPGAFPRPKRKGFVRGIIVPHAGYAYSGYAAAWAYKEIGETEMAEVYVILGVNHSGTKSCISKDDWETPFGMVKVDREFADEFIRNSGIGVGEGEHAGEHSIEVQLPYLQFVSRDKLKKLRILPVMVSHDIDPGAVGAALKKTIGKRKVCIIASSDFTHYGPNYGYMPFPPSDAKEGMDTLDKGAIEFIRKADPKGFMEYVIEKKATICGAMGIAVLLEAITPGKGSLLYYYTSGDVVGDYGNSVGYAAIVFR